MKKHIVIVGGGFAGIHFIKEFKKSDYTITLVDKNNYNFFTPLLYQIATAFLEPSSISYPFRKILKKYPNIRFWMGEIEKVIPEENTIHLNNGKLQYDYLIIATGSVSNFFGNQEIEKNAIPMKSLGEAINMRNTLLQRIEEASIITDEQERQKLLSVVVAGAGPTGVEVSGLLSEMRLQIFPNEYKNLTNFKSLQKIILVDGGEAVLNAMSEKSQKYTHHQLENMGVEIKLNTLVKSFDGNNITLSNGEIIPTKNLIWAAGVTGRVIRGLEKYAGKGNRLLVNAMGQIEEHPNIFALGDIALYTHEEKFPNGHPQLAQVAIQQAHKLAQNLNHLQTQKPLQAFHYKDKGSMAIIGRNKAVADLPSSHIQGFLAWLMWIFIHLFSILSYRSRIRTLYNWASAFLTKDISLRLIVRPEKKD